MKMLALTLRRHMRLVLLLGFLTVAASPAMAQVGRFGVGGQIGDPTGITLKFYNFPGPSIELLAALGDDPDWFFINAHLLYEKHLPETRTAHFYYGPGAFIEVIDRGQDDDVYAGISGELGLNVFVDRFEIFGHLTPRFSVTPETDFELGGGIGARFYF